MKEPSPPSTDDPRPEPVTQYAALCWKYADGKPRVLLVTSRETRRWIIPKGWPMPGKTPEQAAEREAWEEAGVEGKMYSQCIGTYQYTKRDGKARIPITVEVYALKVRKQVRKFPETGERKRKWFGRKRAANTVDDPGLAAVLREFDPRTLRR